MKLRDNFKRKTIDRLDYRYHLLLLIVPICLFVLLFIFNAPTENWTILPLLFVCIIYIFAYSLTYYLHQGRLTRLWQHLEQVVTMNDAIYELAHLSSHYKNEHAFLDALLNKAVYVINGAEMGSIIKVNENNNKLHFEAGVGLDLTKLRLLDFTLEQTFEYRLTKGRCDQVVVVNNIENINAGSTLSKEDQQVLLTASKQPIRSTLSSPIRIDGRLYGMLNLDSSSVGAFSDYDRNLVSILTHEASNAIALYQKSQQITKLANFDSLTGLYNRKNFEDELQHWQQKPHLGSFLLIIDMDNLKAINDAYGHQMGDIAIIQTANAILKCWQNNAIISRFGGDEFVVLCHGPQTQIEQDLENMRKNLNHESELNLSFSYGIAIFENDWSQSFKIADHAMYEQKRAKKKAIKALEAFAIKAQHTN
ncbi:sensor domain-containing diguanylate cyclase [Shewanella morhuae]|uniref:diguanylate cyclase n=1 Tax=Shewanella morhuae TaxID=365591 RepID=A0ABX5HTG4_9GAMM|nr:sensor domain-containing diguanylate cyclase [Shewanella morhuae]PTA49442.1 sensor domain-containing diguanylate cyclase [Shewanella morhuae]SIQ61293.1 diguanylate cyclase (GGDEF) domain-containing protein [Shewanella morhuae]